MSVVARTGSAGLTGRQKAAVFLITIGSARAAEVLKFLSEREIEALSAEMASLWRVKAETADAVVQELAERFDGTNEFALGGPEFAREVLEHLLGPQRAEEILGQITSTAELRPFDFLRRTPPEQIATFLADEAPQTIALVVASLHTTLGASVLGALPPETQANVAMRIATMEDTNPGVVEDVERGLRLKLSNVLTQEFSQAGGVDSLAELLNRAGRSTERTVLEAIAETDGELADEIRQKLFTFDDIVVLTDRDIQLLLREVDQKDLGLALRGVTEEVKDTIFRNMSTRGAEMLQEDLDTAQPQRRSVVEEAQSRIVGAIRRLEDAGRHHARSRWRGRRSLRGRHHLMEAFELPTLEPPPGLQAYAAPVAAAPAIDLEAEARAAREAGHEAGFQAGLVEGQAQMAAGVAALQAAVAEVAAERDRVASAVEAAAVELGLRIAEQALGGCRRGPARGRRRRRPRRAAPAGRARSRDDPRQPRGPRPGPRRV